MITLSEVKPGLDIVYAAVLPSALAFMWVWKGDPFLLRYWCRKRKATRGRIMKRLRKFYEAKHNEAQFGPLVLPWKELVQHFLFVGGTGSGKSLLMRKLLRKLLRGIKKGENARALIFDPKRDMVRWLWQAGVTCEVFSINPFDVGNRLVTAVAWHVAGDIDSPPKAENFAAMLIPDEKGGNNLFFTGSARNIVVGIINSLNRWSPLRWSFHNLISICTSRRLVELVLNRDKKGQDILETELARTAEENEKRGEKNDIFKTVAQTMRPFQSIAAHWRLAKRKLSLTDWLTSDSILLFSTNPTVKAPLERINSIIVRMVADGILEQDEDESGKRRNYIWIDEVKRCAPILHSGALNDLAVEGRSRGTCICIGFQTYAGFREACRSDDIAVDTIGNFRHRCYLRPEANESSEWASKQIGTYETLVLDHSRGPGGTSISERRVERRAVLASELEKMWATNPQNGLTACYVTAPEYYGGAVHATIPWRYVQDSTLLGCFKKPLGFNRRPLVGIEMMDITPEERTRLRLPEESQEEQQNRARGTMAQWEVIDGGKQAVESES